MNDLAGQVAIVTGASIGIGAAVARDLAGTGVDPAPRSRDLTPPAQTALDTPSRAWLG